MQPVSQVSLHSFLDRSIAFSIAEQWEWGGEKCTDMRKGKESQQEPAHKHSKLDPYTWSQEISEDTEY